MSKSGGGGQLPPPAPPSPTPLSIMVEVLSVLSQCSEYNKSTVQSSKCKVYLVKLYVPLKFCPARISHLISKVNCPR